MEGKKLIRTLLSLSILFILITIGFYLYQFGSLRLSENNEDWSNFSNYFNGILTPILTLLNLLMFAYLSFKLVQIEDDRNHWTLQELARPYANLITENTSGSVEITVHNVGLGPMILTDFRIFKDPEKTYRNFYYLINDIADYENIGPEIQPKIDSFEVNSESGAIAKDKSHCLLKVYFLEDSQQNMQFLDLIRIHLNDYTLSITYSDMYGREIECMREKLNFKPWNN
ncbi:hypothetical protein [Flavobacterium sp.]|uniref:hypothetical protein n=1 Tax=Flavobacterium sp. TaxID=239 RepID=UPI002613C6B8|nr:hypothetical protein [Flavobacterium sp.]